MPMLNSLINESFDSSKFNETSEQSILVCAVGYEERSTYILDKFLPSANIDSIICFFFDDYNTYPKTRAKYDELINKGFFPIVTKYDDDIISALYIRLAPHTKSTQKITIHVDYSSMPRGWYCRLLQSLSQNLHNSCQIFFWYSEGNYETNTDLFPNAGIKDLRVFSGRASLRADNNRSHIFGLGYDHIRTQAICSVVDPNYLVVCYAFPSERTEVAQKIKELNEEILSAAAFSFSLPLEDFSFSISKLCDISNELVDHGDVILIPNGPKPLILACSIVPYILNKNGIVCLHINRHTVYTAVNVSPTGKIYGFSLYGSIKDE